MGIWESNINLLSKKSLYLAERVSNYDSSDVEVIQARSGTSSLKYNGLFINSVYDPEKEAKFRVDRIKGICEANMVVCIGFGVGYEVKEIVKKVKEKPDSVVLVVICNIDIFRKALEIVDLSYILNFDRLIIVDGTRDDFKNHILKESQALVLFTNKVEVFIHPVIYKTDFKIAQKVIIDVKSAITSNMILLGNSVEDTLDGIKHILSNLKHIIDTPDILSLKNKFRGIPAICVATGPSLDKNIKELKEAEGKAVIFAGESNIKKLRKENIKYNAASIIERVMEIDKYSLEGKPLEEDVVFFGECVVMTKIFDEHKGKNVVIFRTSTEAESAFGRKLNNLNCISVGASVATMNFALAQYLGFSPIILVGQDLAYSEDGSHHAKETIYDEVESAYDYNNNNPILDELYIKGINGGLVKTVKGWEMYKEWFEGEIKDRNTFCINATEGGALIEGAKNMKLKDAIIKYCSNNLRLEFKSECVLPTEIEKEKRRNILYEMLNDIVKKLDKDILLIENTRELLFKFNCEINDPKTTKFRLGEYIVPINSNFNELIADNMFCFIIQPILVVYAKDIINPKLIKTKDDCIRYYNHSMKYYEQFYEIAEMSKKLFLEGIKNLEYV